MTANNTGKINIASKNVMKTLLVLLENNYTMQELVTKLNETEKDSIFNNSVVSKYINTCRCCGIEIPKIQNKYFVAKIPFGLNLSISDINLLKEMQNICQETFSKKINETFSSFINKLNKFSNKTILKVNYNKLNFTFEAFEKALIEEKKIRLILKNGQILDCIPLNISTLQKRTYFNVKYNNKEKSIPVDKITGFEILSENFKVPNYEHNQAVFKIKGTLASKYNLRENEELLEKTDDYIIVSNIGEDKDVLLSRLLRYDSLCEVRSPGNYRTEMIKIINETLANYGEK